MLGTGHRQPPTGPAHDPRRQTRRLRHRRHRPRGLGPQGDRDRRDRDAGPHGGARRIRPVAAPEGRPDRRFAPHDHPDRRSDRDAEGARSRRALGLVQHLFDAGPCGRGDRRHRHPGLRHQGREPHRLLGLHAPHLRLGGRRHPQHDPRRRRRCHAADPPRHPGRGRRHGLPRHGGQRGGGGPLRRHQEEARRRPRLVRPQRQEHQGCHRGNHHGRPSPLQHGQGGQAPVPGHQRQRFRHQVEVRQPLRLPRIAGRRHPPRHRRDDGRQGRRRSRASAMSARARPNRCPTWRLPRAW